MNSFDTYYTSKKIVVSYRGIWNALRVELRSLFLILLVASMWPAGHVAAQGISSDGRDFFVGHLPGITHGKSAFTNTSETNFFLIGSYTDKNLVTISYFDDNGNEVNGAANTLASGQVWQEPLDKGYMTPTKPGERPEFRSAHIHSKYPVSVQMYAEGSSAGGMYSAIPTSALGQKYVIASWNDNPKEANPGSINRDSSSGEFMIIAPFNNTTVTYVVNSTTEAGTIGVNSGDRSTGVPHPRQVTLSRGQTLWVRSLASDVGNDISGSTVTSDKPVAVIAGQERALLGDPSGLWLTLDNDIRDLLSEQMTPVEDWESEYVSIPFMPPPMVDRLLLAGAGDMYRVYTYDPDGGKVDLYIGNSISPFTRQVGEYQNPPTEFSNIELPTDFVVEAQKKMYVVQYDYFQGQHDSSPGSKTGGKGGKPTGDGHKISPTDELSFISPNEMNVVPQARWRKNAVWKVPADRFYGGAQFVNIITYASNVRTMKLSYNRGGARPIIQYNSIPYQIPRHPELAGMTIRLTAGDYVLTSDTTFACYSYGRTESLYKDIWGYAAPCTEAYGDRSESNPPKIIVNPNCSSWDIRVTDAQLGDEGIADIMLLNDPQGAFAQPPHVSTNMILNPEEPDFKPGDSSVSFQVLVQNPLQDADGWLYVVDRAGNSTVREFKYIAPKLALSETKTEFYHSALGQDTCHQLVLHNNSAQGGQAITLQSTSFFYNDGSYVASTVPALPVSLKAGDSVLVNVCFRANDTTGNHHDSLLLHTSCLDMGAGLYGSGATPIIFATDVDFGIIRVDSTVCKPVRVSNLGNAPLILTKQWVLQNFANFAFSDSSLLPITIQPGKSVQLTFCFTPHVVGAYQTVQNWGTNLQKPFLHQTKDTSVLKGRGIMPGLNWDRATQQYTVVCTDSQIVRMHLINSGTADETVTSVYISGPDAGEFKIVGNQDGYPTLDRPPFPLSAGASLYVDVMFKPDLSKGYGMRRDTLIAIGSKNKPFVELDGFVRHAELSLAPTTLDFGVQLPGTVLSKTFIIQNLGDTDLVLSNVNFAGPGFQVLRGPKQGDILHPGQTDTVEIQFTAPFSGQVTGQYSAIGLTSCAGMGIANLFGFGANIKIASTGHAYKKTFTCQSDDGTVKGYVTGSKGARLMKVEIIDSLGFSNASDFTFTTNNKQVLNPNVLIPSMDSVTYKIHFVPGGTGPRGAIIRYTWVDTSKAPPDNLISTFDTLQGTGWILNNTISANNTGSVYTAVTANNISIPITVSQTFPPDGQVYGYTFTVRYLRDEFIFKGYDLAATGLSNQGPVQSVNDVTDNAYDMVKFNVLSATPLTNLGTVAHIMLEYVVAKDTITSIQVRDAAFLDQAGAPACYVVTDTVPGQFYGTNICGDNILRNQLRGQSVPFSITAISPNPVTHVANIHYEVHLVNTPITMDVFNVLGEKVVSVMKNDIHSPGGYDMHFNARDLPSGTYSVRISSPNYTITKTIVVNK